MAFVNHFYFTCGIPDWGGAFWKTNAYAPWPVWLWLNGHSCAQRQCERAGIGYTALDNAGDKWHLDEVQSRRNAVVAKRFFRKLFKGLRYVPRVLVTDQLGSYQVAHRELMSSVEHRQSRYLTAGPRTPTNRPASWNAR
jgi:hypothetical protein